MARYLLTRRLTVCAVVIVVGFMAVVAIAIGLIGHAPPGHALLSYATGWLIIPYCFGAFVGLMSLIVFKTGRRAILVFGFVSLGIFILLLFFGIAPARIPTITDSPDPRGIFTAAVMIMLFVPSVSATIASVAAALWQSLHTTMRCCQVCGHDLNCTDEAFCPDCGAALAAG